MFFGLLARPDCPNNVVLFRTPLSKAAGGRTLVGTQGANRIGMMRRMIGIATVLHNAYYSSEVIDFK